MFGSGDLLVGVDVGSSAVKAVELTRGGRLSALGSEALPKGAVIDGTIRDSAAVSSAVSCLFDRLRIRTRNIAAALSSRAVLVRQISVPAMSEAELAATIDWEAEHHIPWDPADVNVDYHALPPAGTATIDVLLVAARKESIAQLAAVFTALRRRPVVVDAAPIVLQNIYASNYSDDRVVALLDAGASTTTIHTIQGERVLFTASSAAAEDSGALVRSAVERAARAYPTEGLQAILVTGGGSLAAGFTEDLERRFNVRVDRLDPFRRLALPPRALELSPESSATFAIAVGLAYRQRG